ncbi:hypothetical protein DHW03_13225 [Pedobacter yonginense]|uniref:Uncharacterized protein n=1 Tax=Pedobacter yonginense TaxID=651869 RepID=A0A317EKT0_9SPHI|nr:hypothetical protein DHW03_13225 [Pedobacter yonginense]
MNVRITSGTPAPLNAIVPMKNRELPLLSGLRTNFFTLNNLPSKPQPFKVATKGPQKIWK